VFRGFLFHHGVDPFLARLAEDRHTRADFAVRLVAADNVGDHLVGRLVVEEDLRDVNLVRVEQIRA
jgi:hypothetical protein